MFPLPRIIYAMASDGLVFRFLGTVNSRFHTPVIGTLLAGLLTGLFLLAERVFNVFNDVRLDGGYVRSETARKYDVDRNFVGLHNSSCLCFAFKVSILFLYTFLVMGLLFCFCFALLNCL